MGVSCGKVEKNESIEQALTRELNEEIGIQSMTLTPYQHLTLITKIRH